MSRQICRVREMRVGDWGAVREIYVEGLAGGNATFETQVPTWDAWDSNHLTFGRLVVTVDDIIKGWSALSRVSTRLVYKGVAEVSVYVSTYSRGLGLGKTLLESLIQVAERNGIWTLQASIFPENTASIQLHLRSGFREVGRRARIAKLHNTWRDTILLERRSELVGLD